MLNHELSAQFRDCLGGSKVAVVFPGTNETDHERFGISKITFLVGSRPEDTIIEASRDDNFWTVEQLVNILGEQDSDGDVQVFIRQDEDHAAYYDVAGVKRGPYLHQIIVGAFRTDCA